MKTEQTENTLATPGTRPKLGVGCNAAIFIRVPVWQHQISNI